MFRGEWNGQTFEDKGEIVTFEPERELAYSHFSPMTGKPDEPENYHLVDITLDGASDTTNVTLEQSNLTGGVTDEDRACASSSSRTGSRCSKGCATPPSRSHRSSSRSAWASSRNSSGTPPSRSMSAAWPTASRPNRSRTRSIARSSAHRAAPASVPGAGQGVAEVERQLQLQGHVGHEVAHGDREQRDLALVGMIGERRLREGHADLGERPGRGDRGGQRHRPGHRLHPHEPDPHGDRAPGPLLRPQPGRDPVGEEAELDAEDLVVDPAPPERRLRAHRPRPARRSRSGAGRR